ncbi:hypothetical protein E2C01_078315 [Portunus trituberculatus]|uniref:Uncharacterized protein n=1 Tax=Portunus trituberculatus TaxID=210409 RepID=A0A5B7IMB1_PORTR|nr:hypothetical protein [Portunus trituberculatus]
MYSGSHSMMTSGNLVQVTTWMKRRKLHTICE